MLHATQKSSAMLRYRRKRNAGKQHEGAYMKAADCSRSVNAEARVEFLESELAKCEEGISAPLRRCRQQQASRVQERQSIKSL